MPMLTRLCRSSLAPLLLLLTCAGCLAPPVNSRMPQGVSIAPVAEQLLPESPVAVSQDGMAVALVRSKGLFLLPLPGGGERRLSSDRPSALAFNPSGTELAAVFVAADGSRLRRYATSSGAVLAEIFFPGRGDALLNRDGEWLIFVSSMEIFRFGGNLNSRLLRWDGEHLPSESLLSQMTIFHPILAEKKGLSATLRPQLSPHGDEILFLRLHDPPAFDPYFAVVIRHLESGSERLVAKLPQLRGAAAYCDGGELVAYGDGINQVKIVDPWSEREDQRLLRPGLFLAAPPGCELLWVDEALLHRDGQLLLNLAKGTQPVAFLSEGRLLLRDRERLWLISGLPAVTAEQKKSDNTQLRLWRRWRAEGLIDAREYVERSKE